MKLSKKEIRRIAKQVVRLLEAEAKGYTPKLRKDGTLPPYKHKIKWSR